MSNKEPIDFTNAVFGFDLTEAINDPAIKSVVFRYLVYLVDHKIIDGTPTIITIDEGWAYIRDEESANIVNNWSKTARRNGVALVMATNNPRETKDTRVGQELAVQSPTNLFLASPRSNKDDYSAFDLTEDELITVLNLDVTKRQIAIKQGGNFTVLNFDLGPSHDLMHVLSSRKSTIPLMESAKLEHGSRAIDWLPPFIEAATNQRG